MRTRSQMCPQCGGYDGKHSHQQCTGALEVIRTLPLCLLGLEFCWWGWSEWYKWRWHGDHIDLGPLSVYGIKRGWLWWPVLIAIAPLRFAYNRYAVRRWRGK